MCHCEGINQTSYYKWSQEYQEAGKQHLRRSCDQHLDLGFIWIFHYDIRRLCCTVTTNEVQPSSYEDPGQGSIITLKQDIPIMLNPVRSVKLDLYVRKS